MGTWGIGIKSDDFVLDVIESFKDYLKQNKSIAEASDLVVNEYIEEINDDNDGPLFWIALGEIQWYYGALDKRVLKKIKEDYFNERGFELWREQSEKHTEKRKNVIKKFIIKLESVNPKPHSNPKLTIRPPIYKAGDCLSILLKNNMYGAAIVLTAKHDIPEIGINTIASLDYLSKNKPTLKIFTNRKWLKLTHHSWNGELDICDYSYVHWKKEKYRFEVIGNIKILAKDPKKSIGFISYTSLGEQILEQKKWDKKTS